MRRPASLAQLELPLLAPTPPEPAAAPAREPEPRAARVCARCGWYCPVRAPCPVCTQAPEPGR